jgi:hypothetical protein
MFSRVVSKQLGHLGRIEADPVPARGGGLRLGFVEEGDGAVAEAREVQRLPPSSIDAGQKERKLSVGVKTSPQTKASVRIDLDTRYHQ